MRTSGLRNSLHCPAPNQNARLFLMLQQTLMFVLGLVVGSDVERAAAALGAPERALAGAYEWALPGEAWPVRLRGVTDGERIRELYIYRADF